MSWLQKTTEKTSFEPLQTPSLMNDPYERYLQQEENAKNLIAYDHSSKFSKKWKKLKGKMEIAKLNAINGFMMGAIIGGLFGFALGAYQAFLTRRLVAIPISVIGSGCFFGFIMGCGALVMHSSRVSIEEGTWIDIDSWNGKSIDLR